MAKLKRELAYSFEYLPLNQPVHFRFLGIAADDSRRHWRKLNTQKSKRTK